MTDSFSSAAQDPITRPLDIHLDGPSSTSHKDLLTYYDIDRSAQEITRAGYKRIALQFPDELLHHSVPIFRLLKARIPSDAELYVLADTSYGSCCVDEVAASHVDADAVLHYGHACLSQTSRLPVIYVYGRKHIDVSECVTQFVECLSSEEQEHGGKVLLRVDVGYAYVAHEIVAGLKTALSTSTEVVYTPLPLKADPASASGLSAERATMTSASTSSPTQSQSQSRSEHQGGEQSNDVTRDELKTNSVTSTSTSTSSYELRPDVILYVGGESLALTNLLMTHAGSSVYSYDPTTNSPRLESAQTNKLLMRRYAIVQKARDADVFGILVGTLGVASYLPLISHLRTILKKARKKSYTVSVGKLNPAKLANFLEIECFVVVACPENSVIEAKEFLRPIVTPYELEIALQTEPEWTGEYVLDFKQILDKPREPESSHQSPSGEEEGRERNGDDDEDRPVFSLVTGTYRHAKRYGGGDSNSTTPQENGDTSAGKNGKNGEDASNIVAIRNQDTALSVLRDSASAHFLQTRTFRGLETRLGMDAPSVLEQGRSGIARGYGDDHPIGSRSEP